MSDAPAVEAPVAAEEATAVTAEGEKVKPCCACPDTKKVRDECIVLNGEANCGDLIEAHKQCMRDLGINI